MYIIKRTSTLTVEQNRRWRRHNRCDLLSVVLMTHRCRCSNFREHFATAAFFESDYGSLGEDEGC